jgi:hypothetical protein
VLFIYSAIAASLFGDVIHNGPLDDFTNFETFGRSMMLMFRLVIEKKKKGGRKI